MVLLALPWELGLPAPRTLTSTIRAGRLDAGDLRQEAGLQGVPIARLAGRWPPGTVPGLP